MFSIVDFLVQAQGVLRDLKLFFLGKESKTCEGKVKAAQDVVPCTKNGFAKRNMRFIPIY